MCHEIERHAAQMLRGAGSTFDEARIKDARDAVLVEALADEDNFLSTIAALPIKVLQDGR